MFRKSVVVLVVFCVFVWGLVMVQEVFVIFVVSLVVVEVFVLVVVFVVELVVVFVEIIVFGLVCEFYVWLMYNYIGINMGLFLGFGVIGVVVDQVVYKDCVVMVKDLMCDYFGFEVQLVEFNWIGLLQLFKLFVDIWIVIEELMLFNEDFKKDLVLKVCVVEMNKMIKVNCCLMVLELFCYVELIMMMIFYYKVMMYGLNLFIGWVYCDFVDKLIVQKVVMGVVKNLFEVFLLKIFEQVEVVQVELCDVYLKDFLEWLVKKQSVVVVFWVVCQSYCF